MGYLGTKPQIATSLANNIVTADSIVSGAVTDAKIAAMASTKLTGVLPNANAPSGSVIQVVTVFDNTQYTFSSGSASQVTFYDIAGLQLSITPVSSTSRILLLGMVTGGQSSDFYNAYFRFNRNGTNIGAGSTNGYTSGSTAMVGWRTAGDATASPSAPMIFVDSPSTTSAITYKIQICNSGGSSGLSFVNRASTLNNTWPQGTASSFTAMEIAG